MSSIDRLLERLESVKQTAPDRWRARCPSHQDGRPSLSIRQAEGDRVLIYDFGGCDVSQVLAALGLTLADLYEKAPVANRGHGASRSRIPARDLLEVISEDVSVVGIVASGMLDRRAITATEWRCLANAAARIHRARDHIHGR